MSKTVGLKREKKGDHENRGKKGKYMTAATFKLISEETNGFSRANKKQ